MVIKNIVDIQNTKFNVTDTGFFGIDCTNPHAKLQIGDGISVSTNPILLQVADTLVVIKDGTNKRVGIGKYPEEDLDIDGNIQISSSGQEKITFFDTGHQHEHGKLLYTDDGTGSQFEVFTKNATSGNVEQTFTINNQGAIGLGTNSTFGSSGQFLKSNGTGSAVSWDTPVPTVYSEGQGVSISASNAISIGQPVAITDNVRFNLLTLGRSSGNGILNLNDVTNLGLETVSQVKGIIDGANGGQLEFHTKVNANGGALTKRMAIAQNGSAAIYTDTGSLGIFTQDGSSQQGYIYNSTTGTKDFTIASYSGITNKGIRFQTQGVQRLRIGSNGEFGLGATNSNGADGDVLTSKGTGNPPQWDTPVPTVYTNGIGVSISGSNVISIGQTVGVNDSPTFANLTLGNGGTSGVINLRSFTANGTDTVAQMKSVVDGSDGGSLEFNTKLLNGALIKRMAIKNDGTTEIYTDTAALAILTQDKTSQQGYIYNSITGTKDFTIGSYSVITNKGISFNTQGGQKMRIGFNGELGFGANNDTGSGGWVLLSGGANTHPYWGPAPSGGATYTAGQFLTLVNNQFNIPQSVATNAQPTFYTVSTQAIYGTVAHAYITMNSNRGPYGRVLIGTGYAGFQQEHYVNEFNCLYNGSGTGLYLNWHGGGVFYSGNNQMSDDRVKFNETNITNGLEVIRKLSPEKYTKRLPTEKIGTEEAGFIAQEVLAIPELKFAVKQTDKELIPGDPNTRYYALAYESVFTYAVAGLKELDTIVQKQAQLISSLEARIKTLESK